MAKRSVKRVFSAILCTVLLLAAMPAWAPRAEAAGVEYYGRSQLAAMPNAKALLFAYDAIVAGAEAAEKTIEIYNGKDAISEREIQAVMDAYRRDHAHHFWLGNEYSFYGTDKTYIKVEFTYLMAGAELEQARSIFETAVDKILTGITDDMSQLERELYLHDTLATMVRYDFSDNAHNAYGAIVEGVAVCEGYAEAFQYLLQRAGICSFIALGSSNDPNTGNPVNHAWNLVRIDGAFYHVDLTWDDQANALFHAYFNQTDAVMAGDHILWQTDYALPVCNSTAAMYFTGKETLMTAFDAEKIGSLLKEQGLTVHLYYPGVTQAFVDQVIANKSDIADAAGVYGSFTCQISQLGHEVQVTLVAKSCTHENLHLYPAVDAGCTTDGHNAYYRCACGSYFEDAQGTVAIADLKAWKEGVGKISRTGHQYAGEWSSDEENHWHACACGAQQNRAVHRDDDADGYCDICRYETGKPDTNPTEPTAQPTEPVTTPTEPVTNPTEPVTTPTAPDTAPAEGTDPEVTEPTEGTEPVVTESTEGTAPHATEPTEDMEFSPVVDGPGTGRGASLVWVLIPVGAVLVIAVLMIIRKKR